MLRRRPTSHPRRRAVCVGLVATLATGGAARADAPAAAPATPATGTDAPAAHPAGAIYKLPQILALAERNHPNILAARALVAQARAQQDEAHYAPFSQFKLTGGVALAPTVHGNNTFSPNTDVSLTSSLGIAWRAGIDGVVPLWTFGKISNLWDAADAGVAVQQAAVEVTRDEVRFDVRKAFFGLQLARDTAALLADVRKALAKGIEKLEGNADAEDGNPIDLLKLKSFDAEMQARESEVARYQQVALAGLRFYAGVAELDIPDVPLTPPKHELSDLERYETAARLYRPELQMARAGERARTAQLQLERAQLFPDLGIGLSAGMTAAPEVADQLNPYVSDPGNYFHYGAVLVFQWKLDVLPQTARIRFAEAQLDEVRAKEAFAVGGVAADVERAYAEAADWRRRVDAFHSAVRDARKWLILVQHGIDVGTLEDKELLDPAKAWATQRFNLLNALMEYNVAISALAKATGWDAIAPDGG